MSLRRPNFDDDSSASQINLSPLIDVMFILLLFFIVSMVFSEKSALGIERPKSEAAEAVNEKAATVFVDKTGAVSLGDRKVGLDGLAEALMADARSTVIIDADGSVWVTRIVEIMDICKACGVEKVFIAADAGKALK